MKKKEILRKVRVVILCWCFFVIAFEIFRGEVDVFTVLCMFIFFGVVCIIFVLLKILISQISFKIETSRAFKQYEKRFKYLEDVYKTRYKLYFIGTHEEIGYYSRFIEEVGNLILEQGKWYISINILNKNQLKRVKEILNQTEKMLTD